METRLLNLSSYDINASDTLADYYNKTVSTPFGTVSDNRWSLTWNNIDLSKVFGDDFYNRFNLFKITLVNYNLLLSPTSAISTPITAQHYQDAYVNWFLQGLPFYPPVYNSTNGAVLNTGYLPLDPTSPNFNIAGGLSWTFTKVKTTNISVNMRSVATGAPYNPGSDSTYLWGHCTLTFQITGVPDIIFPTPLPITYGTTLVSSFNASIISGISGEIEYYLDSAKTVQAFSSVVLNAGTSSLYADFVPTNSFYSGSTQSASLLVNVAPTSTLFTTPTAITYGQTPSFSSTGTMPGTFSYFTDSSFVNQITGSTVFNAGTYTIYSRLVPTSTNYAPSFDSKQLVVNKASTFLTFPNITSILYGVTTGSTALASLLTGTYANISGGIYTFYLDNASGQVITTSTLLSGGTYTIYCEYTSQNDNYLSCTGSTSIAIQAHPTSATFSVSTPASIVYGTDLTSILNATADIVEGSTVAGTVSYYKNAAYTQPVVVSDILAVGNYIIYAVFQPTNTTNYLSSVVTTFLTVTQRPTVIATSSQSVVYKSDVTTALTASVLTDLGGSVEGTTNFYYNSGYTDLFSNYTNLTVGTYTVYVRFVPLRANFAISTASYSLTVTQKSPIITFPNVIDASYNATLSSFITSTTADISGSFVFTDVNANTLTTTSVFSTLGQYPITASFTPVDTNYAVATATYTNLYVRYKPSFSFTTATSTITYGNSLSGQLVTNTPAFGSPLITNVFKYITVGMGANTIASATDPTVWVGRTGTSVIPTFARNVAYGNFMFVAVGEGSPSSGIIASSTDGDSWTVRNTSTIFSVRGYGVGYGNNLWVAVGEGTTNSIATSTNGTTWTARGKLGGILGGQFVTYENNLWVAGGTGTSSIATSTDGLSWTGRAAAPTISNATCAAYGNGLWVVTGTTGNCIVTSPDAITWTGRSSSSTGIFTSSGYGVAFGQDGAGNNLWVAVGAGGNTIATSSNGIDWVGQGTSVFSDGRAVKYINGLWVAGGSGSARVATSVNGVNWTQITNGTLSSYTLGIASGNIQISTPAPTILGTTTFRLEGTVVDNSTNLVPRTAAYPIIATFVPTDPTRYYTITTSNTKNITVNKRLFFPTVGNISGYLLDTPPTRNVIFNLTFQDTSSNSMSFSSASIYYYEANASTTYSVVSALPKVSDSYIYTTPFTGNLKTYNYYVELNNFSSDKYVQAFNKYNMTINKRPIVFSFNIPESLKTISYGTPITANHLCATVKDTLTNTVLANKQSTYTFSATDLSQNVIANSVLNSGTYHIFANFVDASNIYLSGNTFSQRSNTLTVTKAKSTLTTPNISSIVYGTTMDGFITGTTKNVSGSVRYFTPQ